MWGDTGDMLNALKLYDITKPPPDVTVTPAEQLLLKEVTEAEEREIDDRPLPEEYIAVEDDGDKSDSEDMVVMGVLPYQQVQGFALQAEASSALIPPKKGKGSKERSLNRPRSVRRPPSKGKAKPKPKPKPKPKSRKTTRSAKRAARPLGARRSKRLEEQKEQKAVKAVTDYLSEGDSETEEDD